MRIALRPSGGRGDYELAGSYNGLHASNLLEKDFFYQVTPSLIVEGKAKAHRLSGKPRIRPIDNGLHPYVIIYSILLLPPPRRELVKTTTEDLTTLLSQEYILAGIDVDLVENDLTKVIFAPTNVWAKNQAGILKVDFAERMAIISSLWSAAILNHSPLSSLLLKHQASIISSDHSAIKESATAIQKWFSTNNDVIPLIFKQFNLSDGSGYTYTGITGNTIGFETEENDSTPDASLKERIRKWRKQADRGPGAREFSVDVREAYDYRCLFSGERFPKLHVLDSAGVDGAHILPWATYQLNSVDNGICLCKQCHWGFDNGLFRLDFDSQFNSYLLSIPENIEKIASKEKFDIEFFKRNTGIIDKTRLPVNQRLWPSPKYISELNSKIEI